MDFDETLMRGIAEAGQGRYKFLATAQDIPKIVSKSVHDLLQLYASEVTLDMRGGEHAVVVRVYGGDDEEDGAVGDAPGLMHIGDLHDSNERLVLAELEISTPGGMADGAVFAAAEWTLTGQRNGAPMQLSGQIQVKATRDRNLLGDEATAVRTAFVIRRAADMDFEVAGLLARRDRARAREVKSRQLSLLREALAAAQNDPGALPDDTQMLSKVIERSESVVEQLEEAGEDVEMVRRQCVQECELNRAMSCASFNNRTNSSPGSDGNGGDIGNLRDFHGLNSPPLSPRIGSPRSSMSCTSPTSSPPLSPRCALGSCSPISGNLSDPGSPLSSTLEATPVLDSKAGPVQQFLARFLPVGAI